MKINLRAAQAAALLLALLPGSVASTAFSAYTVSAIFSDVQPGAWYETNVAWAAERGIVSGYEDGTFRPSALLTEAEFIAMLLRSNGSAVREARAGEAWHAPYYEKAAALGFPVGLAPPGAPINRGQAATLLAASLGERLGVAAAVQLVLKLEISNGRTAPTVEGFDVDALMSRAEAVAFVQRLTAVREKSAAGSGKDPAGGGLASGDEPGDGAAGGSAGGAAGGQSGGASGGNGGQSGGTSGQSGGQSGDGQSGGDEGGGTETPSRPSEPVRASDNAAQRAGELQASLAALGAAGAETSQGMAVTHPGREGSGAVLTKTSDRTGVVLILDEDNAAVIRSAHALLRYAGLSIDQQTFVDAVDRVKRQGMNVAIKIGKQLIVVTRSASPGQMTVTYTLLS